MHFEGLKQVSILWGGAGGDFRSKVGGGKPTKNKKGVCDSGKPGDSTKKGVGKW